MSKFGRRQKHPPNGYEYIEPTITALENELREKVNEPHEGLRRTESQWPVHQINWQKARYVYNMYYKYQRISKEVYEYCVDNKVVDAGLIAKWKKPGYEKLCSTYVINPKNYKFGTVSICRVPKSSLTAGSIVEDPVTGCRGCASGGDSDNIFGNKYGQDLAAIQIAREERAARKLAKQKEQEVNNNENHRDSNDEEEDSNNSGDNDDNENEVVGAADGSSGNVSIWNTTEKYYEEQQKLQQNSSNSNSNSTDTDGDNDYDDNNVASSVEGSKRQRLH